MILAWAFITIIFTKWWWFLFPTFHLLVGILLWRRDFLTHLFSYTLVYIKDMLVFLPFLYLLYRFVIAKWYRLGFLNSKSPFYHSSGGWESETNCCQACILPRPLSLACRYVSSASLLSLPSEHIYVLISSYLDPKWPHFHLCTLSPNTVTFSSIGVTT